MTRIRTAAALIAASLALTSCMPVHVRANITLPDDERVTQRTFAELIRNGGFDKVVLRVPRAQNTLTEEGQKAQSDADLAYNIIEKEFLKAGFTVRDRALLTEILRDNPNIDYQSIQQKIDTDIILEVVSMIKHDFSTQEYTDVATNQAGWSDWMLTVWGWRMEAKVVLVESGEVGAMYTLYWQDTNNDFLIDPNTYSVYTATREGRGEHYTSYAVPVDRAARGFAKKIIADLRGTPAQPMR